MTWQYTIEWHDTSTGSNSVQQAGINSNSKSIVMVSSKPRSQSEKQLISVKAWTTEINQGNLLFLAISGMFLSGHFSQKQAKTKVVKIKNPDFSYWA